MWTGVDAADQMQKWHQGNKSGVKGMCLKTCRQAWKLRAKYPSAISAWTNTPKKYKSTNKLIIPVGAPVFWKGGRFGHVAIQSHKPGYVWTTDLPIKNRIGLVAIDFVELKWGYKFLGWTTRLNGKDINVKR